MFHVAASDHLAFITKLIKEQEPSKAILLDKARQADERESGDAAEGELHDAVVRPLVGAVAGVTRQNEMRYGGHDDGEKNEHGPRETRCKTIRLINAHPFEIRSEAV